MPSLREFSVIGHYPFPIDMLRFDSCYPQREIDAAFIVECAEHPDRRYEIRLQTRSASNSVPTIARWASFGWRVLIHTRADERTIERAT